MRRDCLQILTRSPALACLRGMIARLTLLVSLLAPLPAFAQHMHQHDMPADMMPGHHGAGPREPGQSAFAAIQEIVEMLEADPGTDWSRVNIEALRQHLIDMDNVTLEAQVTAEPVDGGVRFVATGSTPAVTASIQRMVTAHARAMDGVGGWHLAAARQPDGATLTVTGSSPGDAEKIRGLGFIGVMARGMHHQAHHLAIARGQSPHG